MTKITIGNQEVEMTANAATPILFTTIFKKDFYVEMEKIDKAGQLAVNFFTKAGFIMAMQTKKKIPQLLKLTEEDFLNWLCQFEAMDVALAVTDISNLYASNTKTTATPKN